MNKIIKNNLNIILSVFILLQPILDLITGLCLHLFHLNLTLGIIVRILFLALIIYITLVVYKRKKALYIYCIILLYSIFFLLGIIIYKDKVGLFQELQGLIRVFYFPLLLVSLYELKEEIKISKMTLFITLILYLMFIFIPLLLGIGYKTYQITKSGTLGFFNSANEISGIISILTPIMFIIFKENKKIILKVILALVYLVVILMIGTKTPLLSLTLTLTAVLLWLIIKNAKSKKYKPLLITFIAVIIGIASLLIIIPKTNFYKNIEVHLDYLKVDDVTEILEDEKLVDHFIFSQRLTFLKNKAKLYNKAPLYQKAFGIGYLKKGKPTKMIEMDYFDIYYSHGIAGFIVFFSIYFVILFRILREKQHLTFDRYMLFISLLLIIFLSLFTGHIITAPSVSILVVIIILMLSKRKKKRLLFTSHNMEIGGIETALLRLLDNINYEKYDVDVILDEKKGILLNQTNKNVHVKELKVSSNQNILIRKTINCLRKLRFMIFNYHTYDFSCCYATYSLSGNKLSLMASKNNAFYVHNNYKYVYKKKEDTKNFFDNRHITSFRKIIFVANESKKDFLEFYPELEAKTLVLNNFIDVDTIKEKSKDKIKEKKDKSKKLLVFIGRLDDDAKKIGRAINLVKEIESINLWIVGEGPDKKQYEDQVRQNKLESRVSFLGRKKNPYPYMRQADYLILTSDYEGFPVIYLEAIVLKVPIITTIPTSDDQIDINDYANIISKEEQQMVTEVKNILKNPKKVPIIDIKKTQENRIFDFEKLFDEVI